MPPTAYKIIYISPNLGWAPPLVPCTVAALMSDELWVIGNKHQLLAIRYSYRVAGAGNGFDGVQNRMRKTPDRGSIPRSSTNFRRKLSRVALAKWDTKFVRPPSHDPLALTTALGEEGAST